MNEVLEVLEEASRHHKVIPTGLRQLVLGITLHAFNHEGRSFETGSPLCGDQDLIHCSSSNGPKQDGAFSMHSGLRMHAINDLTQVDFEGLLQAVLGFIWWVVAYKILYHV